MYSCRTVKIFNNGMPLYGFSQLRKNLNEENMVTRVKEKRRFMRPSHVKNQKLVKERRLRFNAMVRDRIKTILEADRNWDQSADAGLDNTA